MVLCAGTGCVEFLQKSMIAGGMGWHSVIFVCGFGAHLAETGTSVHCVCLWYALIVELPMKFMNWYQLAVKDQLIVDYKQVSGSCSR